MSLPLIMFIGDSILTIKPITKLAFLLAFIVLGAGFSACDRIQNVMAPEAPHRRIGAGTEVSIGMAVHLTGAFESTSGLVMKRGAELALEELNALHEGVATLSFIVEDSGSTPEGGIAAYTRLIKEHGVTTILGPTTSTVVSAAFPVAQENGVVALSPTSAARGISALGEFLFRNSLTVDRLIPGGVSETQAKLGYQRVATLYDSADVFAQSSDEVLQEALQENGVEILATETFEFGDRDFSAQLTRIKALNPDAIFISAQTTETTEVIIQARQLGIPFEVPFISSLTLTISEIERAAGAAEGTIAFTSWSSTADTPGNQEFVANYRAKYGDEPNVFAAQSYAAVYILSKAIADAGATDAAAIQQAMANIKDLDTVLGTFSFDENGDGVYTPVTLIVKDGKLAPFGEVEAAAMEELRNHLWVVNQDGVEVAVPGTWKLLSTTHPNSTYTLGDIFILPPVSPHKVMKTDGVYTDGEGRLWTMGHITLADDSQLKFLQWVDMNASPVQLHIILRTDANGEPLLEYGTYPFAWPEHDVQVWEQQ